MEKVTIMRWTLTGLLLLVTATVVGAEYQVLCPNENSPNLTVNNLCFRSDIDVSVLGGDDDDDDGMYYSIRSNGCPDHAVRIAAHIVFCCWLIAVANWFHTI